MAIDLDQISERYGVRRLEIQRWIERQWVVPDDQGGGWVFEECDVARVELICELRRDLLIDEEAMPVVLSLMDQLYATRRQLNLLNETLRRLPEAVRAEIEAHLSAPEAPDTRE